jgi:DNA-binding NarL/FixJ family response regulator
MAQGMKAEIPGIKSTARCTRGNQLLDAVELQDVLQTEKAGEKVFIYPQQTELWVNIIPPDTEFMTLYKLTKTEIEIMQLIAQGNSTKMIAYKEA